MSEKMEIEKKKVITPEFRVSYPNVFEAKGFKEQEPKFSVTMLFPRNTDLSSLKKAVFNAATEKWGPKDKWPRGIKLPFRDGNEMQDQKAYENTIFVRASSKQKPQVIDQRKEVLTKESGSFYPGCYARASVIAFAYDVTGNKGVSFALCNLQKLRDGESLGGRKAADEEFDAVDDGSENPDNYKASDDAEDDLGF